MANEIIKPHNFEVAKNKIHSLSKTVSNVSLQKLPTEGSIFPWNNHNITGAEVNELLVSPLQSTFIAQNSTIKSLFEIADEVYKALESLDKEYIQGIITAIKSAEAASNQAKTASRKAFDASIKAATAQDDIKKTIKALELTVAALKDFGEKVNRTTARINSDIENWKQYQTLLESYQHLNDIDSIWTDVEKHKEHLFDWHEKLELFIKQGNSRLEKIESLILQAENDNTLLHQQYNKKIKIAYWIGGSAISLIIVNYIFQIMGLL